MANYKIKGLANENSGYRIKGSSQPALNQEQNKGISSIPEDIGSAGLNLLMAAGEKGMQLPEEFSEAGQSIAERPVGGSLRAGGNIMSGLLEGAKGLYNLPLNLNTYLGSKGVFPFKQTMGLAEKLKIGNTGLKEAVLGKSQKGDQLFEDIGEIAPLFLAPETITGKVPSISSKGIMKSLSKQKAKEYGIAKADYKNLFDEAASNGLTHAQPTKAITSNQANILKNSQPKYHTALKEYIANPSIENAHWAQSELGALERHLDKISSKNGLTPSQIKTYKAVQEARKGIKKSMFSNNALGKNLGLAMKYENLGKKYRENVIPYTSLEDLSEFEAGKLRPRSAVKNLLNDEEFMINLSKKNPGVYLHTPTAKKIGWGAAGLLGYDELKKLLNSR